MHTRKQKKFLIEGNYVAEIEVNVIDSDKGWAPYISLEDALKMDKIRKALKKGDLKSIKNLAKIYKLSPVAA